MAALLHQRGYMPIHANVVQLPGGGVAAFGGDSGAGKSTLAAWFEAQGHRVLADDLCAILTGEDGLPVVFEGIPRVKLWSDALAALGRESEGLQRVASDIDKFQMPMGKAAGEGSLEPLRLERIYLLDLAEEGAPFRIERLSGAEAARSVLMTAFRWVLGQMIQGPRAQFDQSVALARHAAVFRLEREWGLERFEPEAEEIERHMLAPLETVARA